MISLIVNDMCTIEGKNALFQELYLEVTKTLDNVHIGVLSEYLTTFM